MGVLLKVIESEADFIEFINGGLENYGVKILSIEGCACKYQIKDIKYGLQFYKKMKFPFSIYVDWEYNYPYKFWDKFALCILNEIRLKYKMATSPDVDLLKISKLIYH